ncbi:MAG: NAD(P)/FAD-dependent oxidoreductase [Nitrospinota bacterium]|nr:NAD(P)/FAD-dependent oxidoreductase [Nitrospinota bacterium]
MRYDTVIIGAGLSGLAAGARMAHYGKKILILERHYRIGGLSSFYRAGGIDVDVGLHAVTNYNPSGPKSAPMARLLRRLRIRLEDLELFPQVESRITFPSATLRFANDPELLPTQVEEVFPGQGENFRKLARLVDDLYSRDFESGPASARAIVSSIITEPLLVEMLFCPLMFYGCPQEDDMDFRQFALIFLSVYNEGMARPRLGIRPLLELLESRFQASGGELRTRCGVSRVEVEGGKARAVITDKGERIECDFVLSSAGLVETAGICPEVVAQGASEPEPGRMSFIESIHALDTPASDCGHGFSLNFYSDDDKFIYRAPDEPVNTKSGVICLTGNFAYDKPVEKELLRHTQMADPFFWAGLEKGEYKEAKANWQKRSDNALFSKVPGLAEHSQFVDMFTPATIKKFTGHINGAVYGAPVKIKDGVTPVENLFICGTDQGYLGIVGSMVSGVGIANWHLLK